MRGLTTAASLWISAAVGMAAGTGYYAAAVAATALTVFALWPAARVGASGSSIGSGRTSRVSSSSCRTARASSRCSSASGDVRALAIDDEPDRRVVVVELDAGRRGARRHAVGRAVRDGRPLEPLRARLARRTRTSSPSCAPRCRVGARPLPLERLRRRMEAATRRTLGSRRASGARSRRTTSGSSARTRESSATRSAAGRACSRRAGRRRRAGGGARRAARASATGVRGWSARSWRCRRRARRSARSACSTARSRVSARERRLRLRPDLRPARARRRPSPSSATTGSARTRIGPARRPCARRSRRGVTTRPSPTFTFLIVNAPSTGGPALYPASAGSLPPSARFCRDTNHDARGGHMRSRTITTAARRWRRWSRRPGSATAAGLQRPDRVPERPRRQFRRVRR